MRLGARPAAFGHNGAMLRSALLSTLLATLSASAHEFEARDLFIDNPWARAPLGLGDVTSGYLVIENRGETADRLIAARSDRLRVIELHVMNMDAGVMRMRPTDAYAIPAGGRLALQPGGAHLMMFGAQDLAEGDSFTAKLVFERAGEVDVVFNIESSLPALKGSAAHSHH